MVKLYQKWTDLIFLISKWFIQMQKKNPKILVMKRNPTYPFLLVFSDKKPISQYIFFPMIISDIMKWFMSQVSLILSLLLARWCLGDDKGGKNHTYVFFAEDNADTVMFCKFFQYKEMWNDGFRWLEGNYQEMMFVLATFITFSRLSSITRYLHMQIFTNISIRTWYALAYCINNLTENRVEEN